jgi:hypothetical protein
VHATPWERADHGREVRRLVPRSSHAEFQPTKEGPDALDVLEARSTRQVQELVPIGYGRMSESPFRRYRGAAAITASDRAGSPDSGIRAQLCGDARMLNVRQPASPERQLLLDINDFDKTLPVPWEWDVKSEWDVTVEAWA